MPAPRSILTPDETCIAAAMAAGDDGEEIARRTGLPIVEVNLLLASALRKLLEAPTGGDLDPVPSRHIAPVIEISMLGRFRVRDQHRDLTPPPGQPSSVLQLVLLHGGRLHAEELIEHLWPEVDPSIGRTRLRNVLARLRRSSGDLLRRSGDHLCLRAEVTTDLAEFERLAGQALQHDDPTTRVSLALGALEFHAGPLLPDARYEAWAESARQHCHRLHQALLDLLADNYSATRELDRALVYLDQAVTAEPYDEHRYRLAARWLSEAGRHGAARAYLIRYATLDDDLMLDRDAA